MSESAGNESDLSFSEFDAEQEVDPNDLHDDDVSSEEVEAIDILPSPQDNRGIALPADRYDHIFEDESQSAASSSSSNSLQDSPYWVSVKALSVPETVQRLNFKDPTN